MTRPATAQTSVDPPARMGPGGSNDVCGAFTNIRRKWAAKPSTVDTGSLSPCRGCFQIAPIKGDTSDEPGRTRRAARGPATRVRQEIGMCIVRVHPSEQSTVRTTKGGPTVSVDHAGRLVARCSLVEAERFPFVLLAGGDERCE